MDRFEEIYRNNFLRINSFLYKLCNDPQLSEELSQETFYQAFASFHRFRGESEIFTWLASIAKHTYYKYLRKNRLGLEAISLDHLAESFCRTTLLSPEEEVQRKEVSECVRAIIDRIPEKYRDVVILRIYAEMPFSQVAAAMGISEGSAKVIFFRAKKMLLEEFQNEFEL